MKMHPRLQSIKQKSLKMACKFMSPQKRSALMQLVVLVLVKLQALTVLLLLLAVKVHLQVLMCKAK